MPGSEPVIVLVDDRLQSVLAAAAHSWEEIQRGSWRFDLDGEHHHEALAWSGDFDRVLADLRKRKPARLIAFLSADAFAPDLRSDAIAVATHAERLELRGDRLEVTAKRPLPAVRAWKRKSRATDVRALALPSKDAEWIALLEGTGWVALSAEFGRLALDFADVLIAVIPSAPAVEDGSAIELLGEALALDLAAKPAPQPTEPEPAKPEPAKAEPAKPTLEPTKPEDDPAKKKVLPVVGLVTVIAAAALGIAFVATRPDDPCLARKLDVSKDKLSISETPDPECRAPEPIRIYTRDSREQPVVATLNVEGASNDIRTESTGYAKVRLDEIPLGELAIAVEVEGRTREILRREQGATPQDVILTLADACRFAFVDDKGQTLTDITNPTLSFAAGKPKLNFDEASKKWIPTFCPARIDTLTIGGTRDDRTCSRTASAESLLDDETLPWCGATCTVQVVDAAGQAVLDVRDVELHSKGLQPIALADRRQGKWELPCDADGFAGKFAPERITYARGSEVDLELACNDDTWSRTCKLSATGGSEDPVVPVPAAVPKCSVQALEQIFDKAASEQLQCPSRTLDVAITKGKLQQPSDWKTPLKGVNLDSMTCISKRVRCEL